MYLSPADYFHDLETDGVGSDGGTNNKVVGFRTADAPVRWFARMLLEGKVLGTFGRGGSTPTLKKQTTKKSKKRDLASLGNTIGQYVIPGPVSDSGVPLLSGIHLRDTSTVITEMRPIPRVSQLLREMASRNVYCTLR